MPPQATQPYLTVTKGLAVVPEGSSTAKFAVNEYGDAYFAGAVRIDGELQLSGGGTPGLTLGNNEFLAGLTTANVVKRLIGVNASNVVSIDADGLGVEFGGTVTFSGGSLTVTSLTADTITGSTSITASNLTAGRVVIAGTAGILQDDAGLTYNATTNALTITGGSMTSASPVLNITGTLSAAAATQTGASITITGAAASNQTQFGVDVSFAAGYNGNGQALGFHCTNSSASTGASVANGGNGNFGLAGNASGTTAGDNVGTYGQARNGDRSYGLIGLAATNKNSATNIGVAGFGLNGGSSPIQIGGYFGLQAANPTYVSAALLADNGATTSPIQLWRDNGTIIGTWEDGGDLKVGSATGGARILGIQAASGTAVSLAFFQDSSNRASLTYTHTGTVMTLAQSDGHSLIMSGTQITLAGSGSPAVPITINATGDSITLTGALVRFSGTTSSFPALKQTTTVLEVKLADDSAFTNIKYLYDLQSVGNGLTATGTDRATALQLAAQVNNITTAAASTGVILPVGVVGMRVTVFNAGANPVQVYASASETIDTVAGATGVPLTNAKRADFFFTLANTWISAQLGVISA